MRDRTGGRPGPAGRPAGPAAGGAEEGPGPDPRQRRICGERQKGGGEDPPPGGYGRKNHCGGE